MQASPQSPSLRITIPVSNNHYGKNDSGGSHGYNPATATKPTTSSSTASPRIIRDIRCSPFMTRRAS